MWYSGRVTVHWQDEFKQFPYEKQPLMDSEISDWRSKGYYNTSFSGYMYSSKNTMPKWTTLVANELGLSNPGFTFYKMTTLDIMPVHRDHYNTYVNLFGVNREDIWRAVVFLEDWKPGHYLEIDSTGFVNWLAGDYVIWNNDVPHAASNIGTENRYTLQITGIKNG